jgi:hypothetical protein
MQLENKYIERSINARVQALRVRARMCVRVCVCVQGFGYTHARVCIVRLGR